MVEGYKAGLTVYELAEKHGVHRATASEVLKRNGIAMRRQPPTEAQADEMVRLYQEGLSLRQVGDRLGFNASTVLNKLRARGITTRDSHGRS
ncbi:helix-turn-helix domain-containing protein [Leucobacter sp. 1207-22]